jgi:hypothetical protein
LKKNLTILPCYNNFERSVIEECVFAIKAYLDTDIIVVDSNSPDKSYEKRINAEVLLANNNNFDIGAYKIGFEYYPNYDNYICVHDSFLFKKTFNLQIRDFTPFRTFSSYLAIGGSRLVNNKSDALKYVLAPRKHRPNLDFYSFDNIEQLEFFKRSAIHTNLSVPKYWESIFGPMFTCSNDFFAKMNKTLLSKILPTNKNEQMGYERLIGIYVANNNILNLEPYWGDNFIEDLSSESFEKKILYRE